MSLALAGGRMTDEELGLVVVVVGLVVVFYLAPLLWVLASGRSRGGAKFGWFIITLWFSWLGLAAFLVLTKPPKDREPE